MAVQKPLVLIGGRPSLLPAGDTIEGAGGGFGATGGQATLSFGPLPGGGAAETAVTGQAGIGSSARVRVWFQAQASADYGAYEHGLIFPSRIGIAAGNIVAGVGFTIFAETELRLTGDVTVHWEWSN